LGKGGDREAQKEGSILKGGEVGDPEEGGGPHLENRNACDGGDLKKILGKPAAAAAGRFSQAGGGEGKNSTAPHKKKGNAVVHPRADRR